MTGRRPSFWRPYLVAAAMIVLVSVVSYFAFHPRLPFSEGYRVQAVFKSSNGLRKGSPVRIAGVDVGKVVKVGRGPGTTTAVTMELGDRGRPVHRDATVRIRPRVFLEGGFVVDLRPGSPTAPELPTGGTIPLPQTATPVQLHQVLGAFEAPARESMRRIIGTTAEGLADGGAEGLKQLAPHLAPVLRDTAWIAEAARGEQAGDLTGLVTATNRIVTALDRSPEQVGELVDNLAVAAQALADRDDELAASITGTRDLLRTTPGALRSVRAALPVLESSVDRLTPALRSAPRSFRRSAAILRDLGSLVAPSRRAQTIAALETAFRDLPTTVGRLADLFPTVKPLTDCLSSHVVPIFDAKVPDGELSTGRPVWQDFVHGLVGLAGSSQNFDGNGYALRYQFGIDGSTLSTEKLPVVGNLLTRGPSNLRSRPLPRADRKPPPQDPDAPCSEQPVPSLETPSGSAGFSVVPSDAPKVELPALTSQALRRLLSPASLRKSLEKPR